MDWLPLTLLSAFSLATADAISKHYLSAYRARELVIIRFGLSGLLLTPLVLIQPWPDLPLQFWGWMTPLLPLEIVAMLCYMLAIRDSHLANTLPYLAFTPVLTTATGYLLLEEQITLHGFLGILLVVTGAWLLNIEHARGETLLRAGIAPFKAILRQRGSRLMLIAATIYSFTSVISKGAMSYTTPYFFGPFYFAAIGCTTLLVFGAQNPQVLSAIWRRPVFNILVAVTMAIMVVTHFIAIEQVEAAYMIAVKRTSLLFGIAYGIILFKETGAAQHLFAGTMMVAGVLLIAL